MKVKAGPLAKEGWFAEAEYVVLGITMHPKWGCRFIVEESPDNPGLHPYGEVVLTDGRVPTLWHAAIDEDGSFSLQPEEWTAEFWQAYENGDPAAWEVYRKVKQRLEKESA